MKSSYKCNRLHLGKIKKKSDEMAKMSDTLNNKVIPVVMRFVNTRPITAMKNGMLYPIPFIIVGAIFLILGQFPYQPVAELALMIGSCKRTMARLRSWRYLQSLGLLTRGCMTQGMMGSQLDY